MEKKILTKSMIIKIIILNFKQILVITKRIFISNMNICETCTLTSFITILCLFFYFNLFFYFLLQSSPFKTLSFTCQEWSVILSQSLTYDISISWVGLTLEMMNLGRHTTGHAGSCCSNCLNLRMKYRLNSGFLARYMFATVRVSADRNKPRGNSISEDF